MDDNAGKNPDDSENAENKAVPAPQSAASETPSESQANNAKLPVVWSPKLDTGEGIADDLLGAGADTSGSSADAAHGEQSKPRDKAANDASPSSRSLRFAMLAASLAAAAALGSFVGSLSATGVAHFWPAGPANSTIAYNGPQAAKAELAELAALKASVDGASRSANGQFAKLAERLERVERAQAEPAAKLARIAEALDRLEKKTAMAAASAAASPETTGTIPSTAPAASEAKSSDKVLQDWIVREARGGRALIENRHGGMFDITTGSVLPGLGRVESVKRQEGQWVVVTAHGTIYSAP